MPVRSALAGTVVAVAAVVAAAVFGASLLDDGSLSDQATAIPELVNGLSKGEKHQVFFVNVVGWVHAWNAFLSVNSALRIRVLTVPSGSPVISAISECVRPSKNAISKVLRCSVGSNFTAARARSIKIDR